MQAPSLYSHFDSKHAIYDAMFARAGAVSSCAGRCAPNDGEGHEGISHNHRVDLQLRRHPAARVVHGEPRCHRQSHPNAGSRVGTPRHSGQLPCSHLDRHRRLAPFPRSDRSRGPRGTRTNGPVCGVGGSCQRGSLSRIRYEQLCDRRNDPRGRWDNRVPGARRKTE